VLAVTGFAVARRMAILLLPVMGIVACGSPIEGDKSTLTSQPESIWANGGALLPAGHRTVLVADGSGWILSMPFVDDALQLAKISASDGSLLKSTTIDGAVHGYAGAGLAADAGSHLWITYAREIVRFDELTGTLLTWSVPTVLPRLPTDNPLAGSVLADGWYAPSKRLLFIRNDDQRLYSFDPATAAFAVASDLPITTSPISMIAIGPTGEVAVTGSIAGAADFTPAAARLASLSAAPQVSSDVEAVCSRSSGLTYLRSNGSLASDDNTIMATIPAPLTTQVPFTCDPGDNLFEAIVGGGTISVLRLSQSRVLEARTDALIPIVVHGLGGPVNTYANPGVVALMPDLAGGVWVISEAGINTSTNAGSAYPTLAHAKFTT